MLLVRILKAKVQTATKTQMKIQTIQTRDKGLVCLSYNDGVVNEQPVTVALSSLVFFSSAPPTPSAAPPPPFFLYLSTKWQSEAHKGSGNGAA